MLNDEDRLDEYAVQQAQRRLRWARMVVDEYSTDESYSDQVRKFTSVAHRLRDLSYAARTDDALRGELSAVAAELEVRRMSFGPDAHAELVRDAALALGVVHGSPSAYDNVRPQSDDATSLLQRMALTAYLDVQVEGLERRLHGDDVTAAVAQSMTATLGADLAGEVAQIWTAAANRQLERATTALTPALYYRHHTGGQRVPDIAEALWWFHTGTVRVERIAVIPVCVSRLMALSDTRGRSPLRMHPLGLPAPDDTSITYRTAEQLILDGAKPSDALSAARLLG